MRHLAGGIPVLLLAFGLSVSAARSEEAPRNPDLGLKFGPDRVGEVIESLRESPHPYPGRTEGKAKSVWTETIHAPGASYIAPHFSRFDLAPGDSVIVRSPDGSRSWTYEGLGREGVGFDPDGFWGIHIPGDTAIIELYSQGAGGGYGYQIDRFARGFTREELKPLVGEEAICGPDNSNWAKCYQSSEPTIYSKSRAVARLLINGQFACTGWLLGNQGHVLTNQHCIGSSTDAANTSFEFMAEGATCSTSCATWFGCPGTVVATTSTLVRADAPRDYALVKLPTNPTGTYGYLQLRSSGAVVNERIYTPQHPAAWGKRIAVFSSDPQDQSGYAEVYTLNAAACQSGGPPDVGYFADTQGGSSGSPVIAYSDHLVVALHHCANCPNRGVPVQSIISHLGSLLPAGSLPAPPPVYEGYLDTANCRSINGWAWNQNDPNGSVNVDILRDGIRVTTVPANIFRQDLLNAGKGNGYHAFGYTPTSSWKDGVWHQARARVAGTTFELTWSPKSIICGVSMFPGLTPAEALSTGGSVYTVGTQFSSTHSGYITEIGFHRAPGETGTNRLRLYTDSGAEIVSQDATCTSSGWCWVNIPDVAITAGTRYRVAVNTNTYQSKTGCGIGGGITNGPLTAHSGYWVAGNTFPTNGSCSNFFVDVKFDL